MHENSLESVYVWFTGYLVKRRVVSRVNGAVFPVTIALSAEQI
jgi:hypothetical protein